MLLAAAILGGAHLAAAEAGQDTEGGPSETAPPDNVWTRETLTGDWGGLRPRLAERGVTLGFVHNADVVGIVSGGLHRRAEYLSKFSLMLSIDTEPLAGWRGGKVFVYGLGLESTGRPSEHAGDIQTIDNIDAPRAWRVYEAWLQQELFAGRLSLLAGLYDVNREFDVIETATLFLNSSFGIGKDISQTGRNGPSIFPATALAFRLDTRPLPNTYARFAVLDGVPGDPDDVHAGPGYFAFSSRDGVLGIGEIGYVAGTEDGSEGPYTRLGLGGWFYSARVDRIGDLDPHGHPHRSGNHGMYLLGERTLYREPQAPARGLSAFARIGFADSDVNAVGCYAGAGIVYTGLLRGRPEDRLGLAVATAVAGNEFEQLSAAAGTSVDDAEVAIELTYRMEITPWLAIQPDLQYVVDPTFGEAVGHALAVGARIDVAF